MNAIETVTSKRNPKTGSNCFAEKAVLYASLFLSIKNKRSIPTVMNRTGGSTKRPPYRTEYLKTNSAPINNRNAAEKIFIKCFLVNKIKIAFHFLLYTFNFSGFGGRWYISHISLYLPAKS